VKAVDGVVLAEAALLVAVMGLVAGLSATGENPNPGMVWLALLFLVLTAGMTVYYFMWADKAVADPLMGQWYLGGIYAVCAAVQGEIAGVSDNAGVVVWYAWWILGLLLFIDIYRGRRVGLLTCSVVAFGWRILVLPNIVGSPVGLSVCGLLVVISGTTIVMSVIDFDRPPIVRRRGKPNLAATALIAAIATAWAIYEIVSVYRD